MLLAARNFERRGPLQATGLVTLAQCSTVSRHWRSAAHAAAEQATAVRLPDCSWPSSDYLLRAAALSSQLLRTWAAHWQSMSLNLQGDLVGYPLASFLHSSCRALTSLELNGHVDDALERAPPLGVARLEAAVAALPSLQLRELTCTFFFPTRVPLGLTSLKIEYVDCNPEDLELLMLRCSHPVSRLRSIELDEVQGGHIVLRAGVLAGVQLAALKSLHLQLLYVAKIDALDLSWLAGQRSFHVDIHLGDESMHSSTHASEAQWVLLLQLLQSQQVLQSQDTLWLNTGAKSLSLAAQEVLRALQPGTLYLYLPPQSLHLLPPAADVEVQFAFSGEDAAEVQLTTAIVSWDALVSVPGRVCISPGWCRVTGLELDLHVSGCPAGRDALPGHVQVSGFASVSGLGGQANK